MKNKLILLGVVLFLFSTTSCYDFSREQADYESAQLEAKTRIIQAESKASSIKIITIAIKENPEYLKYQMIEGMKGANRIYIPTEAGLPIIEKK